MWVTSKHIKRCSSSLVIGDRQIKTTRYHYTIFRMAKLKISNDAVDAEQLEIPSIAGKNAKSGHSGKLFSQVKKNKHVFTR